MESIRYLGLDLAWAPRHGSGGAVMEPTGDGGVTLKVATHLRGHEDVLGWLARNRGRGGAILAVNAPVIVENRQGLRPCDEQLKAHFSQYQVDDHAVNLVSANHPRTMARSMIRMGFDPDPSTEGDRLVETYTQPAQIMLFELERPIRIKVGPIRSRKDAVARYRELIVAYLLDATPHLEMSRPLRTLLEADLSEMNGTRIGEHEEMLEAVLCAYIAAYLDMRGPDACAFLGDLYDGYILLPTSPQAAEA